MINAQAVQALVAQLEHVLGLAVGGVLGASLGLPISRRIVRRWAVRP